MRSGTSPGTRNLIERDRCLDGLAAVATRCGDEERGARLLGASEAVAESIGYALVPLERRRHEQTEGLLLERLGLEALERFRLAGGELQPEDAIEYALERVRP